MDLMESTSEETESAAEARAEAFIALPARVVLLLPCAAQGTGVGLCHAKNCSCSSEA